MTRLVLSLRSLRGSKLNAARRSGYHRWDKEYNRCVKRFRTFQWHLCASVNMVTRCFRHNQALLALVCAGYGKQSPWRGHLLEHIKCQLLKTVERIFTLSCKKRNISDKVIELIKTRNMLVEKNLCFPDRCNSCNNNLCKRLLTLK